MSWSGRRLLLALPIGLYAFTIPLVANLQLSREVRLFLYHYRSFAILVAVLAASLFLVLFAPRRVGAALRSRWHRALLVAGLLFPVFYSAVAVLKGRVLVPVIGLYMTWAIAVFFTAPLLFGTRPRLRAVVVALLVANAAAWLLGLYLFETRPAITTFEDRASFGYSNPNTYAQILQVIGCASAFLLAGVGGRLPRWRQLALFGVCVACIAFVFAARSRNVIAFGVSAIAAYHILRLGGGRRSLAIGAIAVAAVTALAWADLSEIDRFSSGRISLWERTIDAAFIDGDDGLALLIGSGSELSNALGESGYSDIRGSATFEKFHVDNFYLELVVEGGLIGAVLFLWPYVLLMVVLWRLRRDPAERTRANLGLAMVVGFAVQGSFVPTFPSFNSPIGFMFAVVAVSLVASGVDQSR
jgi:hypothetical protein